VNEFPAQEANIIDHMTVHRAVSVFKILDINQQKDIIKELPARKTAKILNEDLDTFCKSVLTPKFDLVILSSVLHELLNPLQELSKIKSLLKSNGLLFIVTPNNQSIHRLLGVFLGILDNTSSLTSTEIKMQQYNNFSVSSLGDLLNELNFTIDLGITSFLKPHTHAQMQAWVDEGVLTKTKLESLYELSGIFEPYNSEIFVLARKHEQ
jgi:SAM-dependent methyltransferase